MVQDHQKDQGGNVVIMKKFTKPEFKLIKNENKFIKFYVEPLEQGYSITLGNALRRILISSIYGPAIFGIKIKGSTHEFGHLEGVKENISKILLNLKSLILKVNNNIFENEKFIELTLSSKNKSLKKHVLSAGDIVCPTGVELINSDLEILHFEDNADVDMTLYAKISHGYKTFNENKEECKEISADIISIDSNFSPVKKVNFFYEDIKIGKNSDLERLIMEVETNGSVSPQEAISISSNILIGYFDLFDNAENFIDLKNNIFEKLNEEKSDVEKSIDKLGLSQRSKNCLRNNNISTIKDLLNFRETEIKQFKNLGDKSFDEIKSKLKQFNLFLK